MRKVSQGQSAWCSVRWAVDPSASSMWMYVVLVVVCRCCSLGMTMSRIVISLNAYSPFASRRYVNQRLQ